MKNRRGSKAKKAGKVQTARRKDLVDVRERLRALLEALVRQLESELKGLSTSEHVSDATFHEPLAHVELDGFVYVLSRAPARPLQKSLSPRELEVMRLLAHGLQTKEIARKLKIQIATVETHLRRIRRKLGIDSRAVLAQEYLALS